MPDTEHARIPTGHVPAEKYRVAGIRRAGTATASARTFLVDDLGAVTLGLDDFADLHMHHIDGDKAQVFWCRTKSQQAVMAQPFYYQGIRDNATEAYSVNFSDLAAWQRPLAARPVFIFSIGRCGSTLFSNVCKAAGLLTWSEPDTFTNLAIDPNLQAEPSTFKNLTRVALVDLADKAQATGATDFGIKLRSQVTPICEDLCAHHPNSVSFFLVRDPLEWARSMHRLWGMRPVRLAKYLIGLVEGMRLAKARGLDIQVVDYRSLVERPLEQVATLGAAIGAPLAATAEIEGVMKADSQRGTTIERGTGHPVSAEFEESFTSALSRRAAWLLEVDPQDWLG